MTDQTATDRIPLARSVIYAVRGVPEVAEEYNPERTIVPTEITLHYRAVPDGQLGRVSAYVKGWWMQDGKRVPMDKPVGRWFYGDTAQWPEWLAEEARLHDPEPADRAAALTDAERTMLTYALDQAQEHIWSRDGFTDEDQAAVDSLRRMANEARQDGPL
ncbi:hypothetical protein [Streptomyces luteogriseus]|uniref:hypothetical protein n=1 Tax=Streptomyces luteogriseus TaxID=68233 RepID=UPI00371014EF